MVLESDPAIHILLVGPTWRAVKKVLLDWASEAATTTAASAINGTVTTMAVRSRRRPLIT
jgi:hypothetical protein